MKNLGKPYQFICYNFVAMANNLFQYCYKRMNEKKHGPKQVDKGGKILTNQF